MNKKNILKSSVAFMALAVLGACSTDFLEDKKDYGNMVDVYENYQTATAVIDGVYAVALTDATASFGWASSSAGSSDFYSQCTEEYSGLSKLVDGTIITSSNSDSHLPNMFYNERKTANNLYGWILTCNDALIGLEASSGITAEEKNKLMGQAYFFRAWVYYRLVKEYGGVPLVTDVKNPISSEVEALTVPRSTTKECIDFICADLDKASELLPAAWDASNYGRVTSGAALALQGRARLLYASPVFNRADDAARWNLAYESNKAAIAELTAGGFGLAYEGAAGVNAAGWGKMFSEFNSSEAVFVKLYNNVNAGSNTNPQKWNGWENGLRPINTNAGGGKSATDLMVDLFPMADGVRPGQGSDYYYDENAFMLNRDPRFYRTFGFPGVYWKFSGDPTSSSIDSYPYKGSEYALWNYVWYDNAANRADETKSGFSGDGLGAEYKGVYIRKRSDDYSINNSPLYVFKLDAKNGFEQSASPYMEIRYAEVLLNFAEAACGAGYYGEALEALRKVRMRVGYTDECGLPESLASDRGKLFGAILYERQIELAYEGKRFDDMRRWMLWDGGVGQGALNASWELTGFGGNTCTYIGEKPFNGQRRDGLELVVKEKDGVIGSATATDPYKATRPTPCDLSKEVITDNTALVEFYASSLVRKKRTGDDATKTVQFLPQYYLMPLKSNAQLNNPTLKQTIGWDDLMTGGRGTFDPLAE